MSKILAIGMDDIMSTICKFIEKFVLKRNMKCPFCGCNESRLEKITSSNCNEGWAVICNDCGARTAVYANKDEALMAWNNRFVTFIRTVVTICIFVSVIFIWIHIDRLRAILHSLF